MGMYPVAVYYNNHKIHTNIHNIHNIQIYKCTNIHNTTQNYNTHKIYTHAHTLKTIYTQKLQTE
jgi:hypothetical protein